MQWSFRKYALIYWYQEASYFMIRKINDKSVMEILFSASSASPTTHSMLFYSIVQLNWRCVLAHFRSLGCRCIFPIFVSWGRTKLQRNLNGITTSTQKEVWFWRPNISNIRLQTNFTLDILHFFSIFKYVCVSWNAQPFYIRKKCTEFVFDTIQADANIWVNEKREFPWCQLCRH